MASIMHPKRIFITGASGCIGQYIVETLIQRSPHELFLLVRNPDKLKVNLKARPGVTTIQGDLKDIERHSHLLKTMDTAILTAAAWGGVQETYDINVVKTIRLMNLLDPDVCQQVIYFSTASLLNQNDEPLKEAGQIGTDYIQSKFTCHQQLAKLAIAPRITTVFPTLVFGGGGDGKPDSHLTGGLPEVVRWVNLIRFLKADASFHFLHGQDIAQVIAHLVDHPPALGEPRQIVLGNPRLTVDDAVEQVCAYLGKSIYFRIPLSIQLANLFIALFRIQMAAWDYFCMNYRHFTYKNVVSPLTYDLPALAPTIADLLRVSGIPRSEKK